MHKIDMILKINSLEEELNKYKTALNKSCEMLYLKDLEKREFYNNANHIVKNEKKWKEWLLKDE